MAPGVLSDTLKKYLKKNIFFQGLLPVSYQILGTLPRDFRVGVFVDGAAMDVVSDGVLETPFRTPFRTFNAFFAAGQVIYMCMYTHKYA